MTTGILIDYYSIITPKMTRLIRKIGTPPLIPSNVIGLVLVVPITSLQKLESLEKGDLRIRYINTNRFVNSIISFTFLDINYQKKSCRILNESLNSMKYIIDCTVSSLPNDFLLLTSVHRESPIFQKVIDELIVEGFSDPFLCYTNSLCMIRENNVIISDSNFSVKNDILYVLSQSIPDSKNCSLSGKLSDSAIKYLKNTLRIGSSINFDGTISQKEIAGKLQVTKISENFVCILDITPSSILIGSEEQVKVVNGLFNFHSHPNEAYERNSSLFGWPSAPDYVAFLYSSLKDDTIAHFVISREGIYVISLYEYWLENLDKLSGDLAEFILTEYDFCNKKVIFPNPTSYVKNINKIEYKNFPLFIVQYFDWKSTSNTFSLPFRKIGDNCFARQSTYTKYKDIYG